MPGPKLKRRECSALVMNNETQHNLTNLHLDLIV
jgi:hypothetical protein